MDILIIFAMDQSKSCNSVDFNQNKCGMFKSSL
jgi:hypothetical protein